MFVSPNSNVEGILTEEGLAEFVDSTLSVNAVLLNDGWGLEP